MDTLIFKILQLTYLLKILTKSNEFIDKYKLNQ